LKISGELAEWSTTERQRERTSEPKHLAKTPAAQRQQRKGEAVRPSKAAKRPPRTRNENVSRQIEDFWRAG